MIPDKLKVGDEVRIVSLAKSASDIDDEVLKKSVAILEGMGLKPTFAEHVFSRAQRGCPTDDEKVADLHAAFLDENVKGILAVVGGFNSNQLLDQIDWNVISMHPKIVAGFSDITVISHAIYAKTGIVCYVAPNLYCFGLPPESGYSAEYFRKCLFADSPDEYELKESAEWYDYPWRYDDKSEREPILNEGVRVIQHGIAEGTVIGGNMCSLNLLNGTGFFPSIEGDIILCIEDDSYDSISETFERNLQSIIQQPYFSQVKALLIGRFQKDSMATERVLPEIIASKNLPNNLPIAYNLDFGHTDPKFTYPIGGRMSVKLTPTSSTITILHH